MQYPEAMQKIGFGYDSHRFGSDKPLILGTVHIAHSEGVCAHSDGDAVLHALADAIFGAIGSGDIGEHFSDTDPEFAGAGSSIFVARAIELANARGYRVGNCDITIVAEKPNLKTYKPMMKSRIAELLSVDPGAVAVKAKTNEAMGAIGRGEGIAVIVAVILTDEPTNQQ